ncbi:MAG TPA: 2-amino-4-hydroxy-6-hydroxymethyldihydropteridine diphosphokinase [Alphaproteobacteria bacterium]|nr:2-amino-4-hydroxy-6-hydroxymethyldihydropteridine diphosphokinase [Alphaproteobacteria bacterium]
MIFIGLGGNMPSATGSPEETIKAALAKMPELGMKVVRNSKFYRSAPVPVSDQPWFINAVAEVETKLSPQALMAALLKLEESFGRRRAVKNDPRSLDLDLLDYNGMVLREDALELPHPRLHERAFVLLPLQEIAPQWKHPVSGKNIAMLAAELNPQEIQKI